MAITAERIKLMLDQRPSLIETFIIRALEKLLGPSDFNTIVDELVPVTVSGQAIMFGHKLGEYSGLDRTTIKAKFTNADGEALTDDNVDDIFEALGVVEGEGIFSPFSDEPLGGPEPEPEPKPGVITGDEAKAKEPEVTEVSADKKSEKKPKK
jgi:hypothetical protein